MKSILRHFDDVIMTSQSRKFHILISRKSAFFSAIFRHEAFEIGENAYDNAERKFNVLSENVVKKFRAPQNNGDIRDCLNHFDVKNCKKIAKTASLVVKKQGHPRTPYHCMMSVIVSHELINGFQVESQI